MVKFALRDVNSNCTDLTEHDLSRNECVRTSEEHRNEEGHPSGEVFRKIRLYHLLNDGQCERRWWARLSKSQSKDLKQLIRDERYATAFDRLLPWPGLWYSVQLGSLRRLLAMRCHDVSRDILFPPHGLAVLICFRSA